MFPDEENIKHLEKDKDVSALSPLKQSDSPPPLNVCFSYVYTSDGMGD